MVWRALHTRVRRRLQPLGQLLLVLLAAQTTLDRDEEGDQQVMKLIIGGVRLRNVRKHATEAAARAHHLAPRLATLPETDTAWRKES